jgi:small-conductance mechanosensitive channel
MLMVVKNMAGKGLGAGVVGILITLLVTMIIGIIVIQALISSQTQAGWSLAANSTWTALQSNIWIALTLMVIIPIIIGAVAILGYLRFGGG